MSNYNYNTLCHHGIKGQKWGIRRFQNEDGSLTAAGRKRYGVDSNGKMSKQGEKLYKDDVDYYKSMGYAKDAAFRKNLAAHENLIARANMHNLQSGREHLDDDRYSKTLRNEAVRKQKEGKKILDELFKNGYYQDEYGFDANTNDYNKFKYAYEMAAAKGKKIVDEYSYETAVFDYTNKILAEH